MPAPANDCPKARSGRSREHIEANLRAVSVASLVDNLRITTRRGWHRAPARNSIWRDEQVLRSGPPDSLSCNSNELCLRRDAGRTLCLEAPGLVGGDQPAASAYSACYRAATSGSDWPHPPRRAPRGPREPIGSLRAYAANSIYTTNRSFSAIVMCRMFGRTAAGGQARAGDASWCPRHCGSVSSRQFPSDNDSKTVRPDRVQYATRDRIMPSPD